MPPGVSNADFVVKKGGYTEIARGTVALPNGTFQASLSEPGTLARGSESQGGGQGYSWAGRGGLLARRHPTFRATPR